MNWENLARAGYETYRNTLKGSSLYTGIPEWDMLNIWTRNAWIEATREIVDLHNKAVLA